jgi:hypothetical protein
MTCFPRVLKRAQLGMERKSRAPIARIAQRNGSIGSPDPSHCEMRFQADADGR